MNEQNTAALIKAAPLLYRYFGQREEDRPPMQAPLPIAAGFQCGDGWFDLLMRLSLMIEGELIPKRLARGFTKPKLPFVSEVSSNNGRLRFALVPYMSDTLDLAWLKAIEEAIEESERAHE